MTISMKFRPHISRPGDDDYEMQRVSSGTDEAINSEAVMHPDDECRPVAWQPSNAFSELMGSPVDPAPPPLQHGDEVWVRAKITHVLRPDGDMFIVKFGSDIRKAYMGEDWTQMIVPLSAIRRIEGEVKP